MNRRALVALLLAAPAGLLCAQPAAKLWRVGYLSGTSEEAGRRWLAAFVDEMRKLGYAEGRNLVVDRRFIAGRFENAKTLAAELAARKPDAFLVYGADAAIAARNASGAVPVVMANVLDPVASGLVASLARPGGNITGVADSHGASITKRLELLKEVVPSLSRVAVFWRPAQASHPLQLEDLKSAAPRMGMTVRPFKIEHAEDIDPAFAAMRKEHVGALLVLGDSLMTTNQRRIADLAYRNRLPAVYTLRSFANAGGLLSYGTDFAEQFRRAASYVDRIFKGARPADLPVVQPEKFELVVNLQTARALGIAIPQAFLARADEVIR